MNQIQAFNKVRNTTYVYETESQWDKDKKQSVSKRKLIGKIDPKTGNIIPTGSRGRKKARRSKTVASTPKKPDYKRLYEETIAVLEAKDATIVEQRRELARLDPQLFNLQQTIEQIRLLINR